MLFLNQIVVQACCSRALCKEALQCDAHVSSILSSLQPSWAKQCAAWSIAETVVSQSAAAALWCGGTHDRTQLREIFVSLTIAFLRQLDLWSVAAREAPTQVVG